MTIPETVRPEKGRILCMYGDAGWGSEVARDKYKSKFFSDSLVTAAAELIRQKWNPSPPPEWITAVPSQRHAELVRNFAERLALLMDLPFVPALRKKRMAVSQKEMQNSPMQLRNVLEAFEIIEAPLFPAETSPRRGAIAQLLEQMTRKARTAFGSAPKLPPVPVLLIDDVVDSGWTLTLIAVLLRLQGSGPVYPFALAKASPRGR